MNNNILKSADLKQTKKRNLILSVLESAQTALTVEEIAELASKDLKINISTIYRALNTLAEKDIVIKTLYQDGKTYFEINNHTHRHSLICTKCNKKVNIDICPLEPIENNLAAKTGYTITGHNLEIYGTCPDCQEKPVFEKL